MRGGHRFSIRRWVVGILACLLSCTVGLRAPMAFADPGTLDLARDFVNTLADGQAGVQHSIYFVLPTNAQQIDPNGWILIDMPSYSSITVPNLVDGVYGTPTVTVVGTTIKITNISVLPGGGVTVADFSARNPNSNQNWTITISVAQDANGTVVRNQAKILPSESGNIVGVSATVNTPLASLNINGYTSPSSFVTLTEGSTVQATTTSDGTGYFTFLMTGLQPGAHTYRLVGTDNAGRATAQNSLDLFLLESNLTSVSGILLSPSNQLDKTAIDPGNTLTISGRAKPSSTINVFVESPLRSYTTATDGNGDWSYTIPGTETSGFTPGQYRAYANVQDTLGNQSLASPSLSFTVNSADSNNPPPPCDISHGDLNCDHVTNLTDFSILLFHWQTNHKVADINGDGHVNLTDFSIMMFYFTR